MCKTLHCGRNIQEYSAESYHDYQQMATHCCCILDHVTAMADIQYLQVCQLYCMDRQYCICSVTSSAISPAEVTLLLHIILL